MAGARAAAAACLAAGLVQAAWASAGVSTRRVTYDQWAALPHISESALQPGGLLY
ncbi:MAG: hypothetical protein ACYCVZ_12175 [Streptosporangiaceae bacterium]